MKKRVSVRSLLALVVVLGLVASACGDSDSATAGTTAAPTTAVTTTVATYDLEAAVTAYAASIPEGFNAVGDTVAFKDAMTSGGAFVIDVREPGEYAEGHIEGAVNIPLRTLTDNLDKIPTDRQVFVYCKSGHRAGMALSSLGLLGYDNVSSYAPSMNGWLDAGEPVTTAVPAAQTFAVPDIAPQMLAAVSGFVTTIPEGWLSAGDVTKVNDAMGAGAFVLDVRQPTEYAEGHIPGAVNVPLRELGSSLDLIPADTSVIVYCKSGHRQAMSVPILHVLGVAGAKGFPGSWNAWIGAEQPVETV